MVVGKKARRKPVEAGLIFGLNYSNAVVAGESGLGKSTLVNTLFNSGLYPEREDREPTGETPKTVDIQVISGGKPVCTIAVTL